MSRRRLGNSDIEVTPVALGCWPISGMTSVDVNDNDSLATLHSALDAGVNFLDTAYCYGPQGESEKLIARVIANRRAKVVLATKGGVHWDEGGNRVQDARPIRLRFECDASLRRLATDYVDLLYLHTPDPSVPVAESAGELRRLMEEGKTRTVGVSNFNVVQLEQFHAECPLTAVQPPYNMLQRQIEDDILPWCRSRNISVVVYWPLMKGLLAGRMPRDHVFQAGDGRAKYPMYSGSEWRKNHEFLDELRRIAEEAGRTVAQLVINWTIHQPGVTAALCGAKRAYQIQETAGAMGWELSRSQFLAIEAALERRGTPVVGRAI